MPDVVRPVPSPWLDQVHEDRCRGAGVRDHLDVGSEIPLISLEFNLPHFEQSPKLTLEKLRTISSRYTFNVAITEPPLKFEFDEGLMGAELLAEIKRRAWFYVELCAQL
jgi:hypothetical protein